MELRLWLVSIFAFLGWAQILLTGGLTMYAWVNPWINRDVVVYECPVWKADCNPEQGYVPFLLTNEKCQYNPWDCLDLFQMDLEPDESNTVSFWNNRGRTKWEHSYTEYKWLNTTTRWEDYTFEDILAMNETEYRKMFPYPFVYTFDRKIDISYPSRTAIPYTLIFHITCAAAGLLLLRLVLTHTLISAISNYFEILPKDFSRFVQSFWEMSYYLVMWSVLTTYFVQQDYFWNVIYLMEGNFPALYLPSMVYWIWVVHMGWYVFGLFALVVLDPWKSDFVGMLIHHAVTLGLLMFSLEKSYWRWGMWVLFSHDICDVYLQFLRILRYMDNSKPFVNNVPLWFHGLVFGTLPASWLVFRLGIFPLRLMYIAAVWTYRYFPWEICQYYLLFNGLLMVLLGLQLYWGFLIFKIVWLRVVGGEEFDDIRDKSSDEDGSNAVNRSGMQLASSKPSLDASPSTTEEEPVSSSRQSPRLRQKAAAAAAAAKPKTPTSPKSPRASRTRKDASKSPAPAVAAARTSPRRAPRVQKTHDE